MGSLRVTRPKKNPLFSARGKQGANFTYVFTLALLGRRSRGRSRSGGRSRSRSRGRSGGRSRSRSRSRSRGRSSRGGRRSRRRRRLRGRRLRLRSSRSTRRRCGSRRLRGARRQQTNADQHAQHKDHLLHGNLLSTNHSFPGLTQPRRKHTLEHLSQLPPVLENKPSPGARLSHAPVAKTHFADAS